MTHEQEKIRNAVDDTLAELTADPFLAGRVLAAERRKPSHLRIALVLAAVIVAGMAALAVAGGNRNVNWLGEPAPTERVTNAVYELSPEEQVRVQREFEIAEAYLQAADEPEQITFTWPELNRGASTQIILYADDMAHFAEVMAGAPYMPVPQRIPEGYEFVRGTVHYGQKPDTEMQLISDETTEDGLTVKRYRADKNDIFVTFYMLQFRCGEELLGIGATLSREHDPAEYAIPAEDGGKVLVLSTQQYDHTVFTERNDRNILWILDSMEQEMPYRDPGAESGIGVYKSIIVSAEHAKFGAEPLAAIFGIR